MSFIHSLIRSVNRSDNILPSQQYKHWTIPADHKCSTGFLFCATFFYDATIMCNLSLGFSCSCCCCCYRLFSAADNRKCKKKQDNVQLYNLAIQIKFGQAILLHGRPTACWKEKLKTIMRVCMCVTHENWQIRVIFFFKYISIFPTIFEMMFFFGLSIFGAREQNSTHLKWLNSYGFS